MCLTSKKTKIMNNYIKYILYTILVVVFVKCSTPNKQDSNTTVSHKYDVVKSCKMYSSDFVLIDPNDKGVLIQEFRFNKKGFANELIRFDINGKIIGRFDIFGENTPFSNLEKPQFTDTVISIADIDSLGKVKNKEIKTFNKQGLLTKVEFYRDTNILTRKNTYKYNNDGRILEDVYWDVDMNKPKQKIRYEYEYYIN